MGMLIELSPAAVPFVAELRSSSFYLSTSTGPGLPARLDEPWSRDRMPYGQFTVRRELVPAFRAALDEVGFRVGSDGAVDGGWVVRDSRSGVTISGPAVLYGLTDAGTDEREIHDIEIEYRHLVQLRTALLHADTHRRRGARGSSTSPE